MKIIPVNYYRGNDELNLDSGDSLTDINLSTLLGEFFQNLCCYFNPGENPLEFYSRFETTLTTNTQKPNEETGTQIWDYDTLVRDVIFLEFAYQDQTSEENLEYALNLGIPFKELENQKILKTDPKDIVRLHQNEKDSLGSNRVNHSLEIDKITYGDNGVYDNTFNVSILPSESNTNLLAEVLQNQLTATKQANSLDSSKYETPEQTNPTKIETALKTFIGVEIEQKSAQRVQLEHKNLSQIEQIEKKIENLTSKSILIQTPVFRVDLDKDFKPKNSNISVSQHYSRPVDDCNIYSFLPVMQIKNSKYAAFYDFNKEENSNPDMEFETLKSELEIKYDSGQDSAVEDSSSDIGIHAKTTNYHVGGLDNERILSEDISNFQSYFEIKDKIYDSILKTTFDLDHLTQVHARLNIDVGLVKLIKMSIIDGVLEVSMFTENLSLKALLENDKDELLKKLEKRGIKQIKFEFSEEKFSRLDVAQNLHINNLSKYE